MSVMYQGCQKTKMLIMALLGLGLVACGSDEADSEPASVIRPVKTITVSTSDSQVKKIYPAMVLSSQQVDLSFRVSGKILELPIKNGQKVKEGDVIAQLDQRDFKAQITQLESQLNQANAQLKAMQAGARPEDVAALRSVVRAAEAQVKAAQSQFARTEGLVKKQLLARAELDKDRSALDVAKADLDAKRQDLKKGKAGGRKEDVAAQKAAIDGLKSQLQSLEDTLADTTLRAPFDGVIASRKVENFANIQAKEAIAVLQKLAREIDVVFDIPSSDVVILSGMKDQLSSKVVLDSFPEQEFVAEMKEFSTEADTTTQTYQGRFAIKPAKGELILPGMTGNIIISGKQSANTQLALPVSAITSRADGKPFIWIVESDSNKVLRRDVTLGSATGEKIIVQSGLKEGEIVVTAGLSALQEGMVVKPMTKVGE